LLGVRILYHSNKLIYFNLCIYIFMKHLSLMLNFKKVPSLIVDNF